MSIYSKVEKQLTEWMPNYVEVTYASIKKTIEEEQDFVDLFFGTPGKGKSNLAFQDNILKTKLLNEILGEKRKFSVKKQSAWMGSAYISLFSEPAEKFSRLLNANSKDDLDELIAKNRGRIWWLDEAKDLNVLEFLGQFNRTFSGILATCRALQFFYTLCLDTPTKLIPNISDYRINKAQYIFITPKKHKFPDGKTRHTRACATYGRREFNKVVFDKSQKVRRSLNMPTVFIKRYPPFVTESIPMFPKGKMWDEYKKLKYGNMGQIILDELGKLGVTDDGQMVSLPVCSKILNMSAKNLWWAVGKGGIPIEIKKGYMKIDLKWVKNAMQDLKIEAGDETKVYAWTKDKETQTINQGLSYLNLKNSILMINEKQREDGYEEGEGVGKKIKRHFQGLQLVCPKCKNVWLYNGLKMKPSDATKCPKCSFTTSVARFFLYIRELKKENRKKGIKTNI